MKISVVTVCLNAEDSIEETIKSVVSQSYDNIEYLIIDGKSSDRTTSIIDKYRDKINYLVSEKDNGIYEGMNKGILAATGDFLFFLNAADTFCNDSVIEKFVSEFSIFRGDFFYGSVLILDQEKGDSFYKYHNDIDKMFFFDNVICQQAIFYKRDVFDSLKCGLFDQNLKIAADYEWLLRAFIKHKLVPTFINMPVAIFKWGGISNDDKMAELLRSEREKIIRDYFTNFEIMVICNRWVRYIYRVTLFKNIIRRIMSWNLS